ncbi:MAG: diguanylate cyclase, partial [Micromonosporaceae bacterium]|nr:diguanylate cyclase [Micromonosporaceae bacterium]
MAPTHREPAADGSRRGTVRWVIAALALAALSAFPITMSVTALSASHTLRRTLDDRAMFDAVGTMVTQMNVELLRFQRAGSADAAKRFSSAADASTSSLRDIESTGGPQARTDARRLSTEHAAYVAHADQVFQLQAGSAELAEAQSAVAADFEILAQDLGTVLLEHSSLAQEQADDLGNTQLGLVAAALVTLIVAIGMTVLVLLAGPARRRAGPEASVSTEAAARSSVDPLTELPDEAAFEEHLQAALIEALQTGGRGVTVLSVSLVGFQQVEQTHGQEGCQQLLVAASRRLRRVVRDVDIVGRLGDSGFCVLLRDMTNRPDVQAVTNRIDHVLSRDFRILSGIVSIKISIGIAIGPPDSDPKDIMRRSSTAMHRAETVGGGMAFAERKTGHGILTPVSPALGHELQDLLERGDPTGSLTVEYQPVVRLADGVTTSVEALASWQHPTYGSITAEELARLADASGLATHLA